MLCIAIAYDSESIDAYTINSYRTAYCTQSVMLTKPRAVAYSMWTVCDALRLMHTSKLQ